MPTRTKVTSSHRLGNVTVTNTQSPGRTPRTTVTTRTKTGSVKSTVTQTTGGKKRKPGYGAS
ncbi:MAG: hypothetical protein WCG93_17100 [Paludibacter sp.]